MFFCFLFYIKCVCFEYVSLQSLLDTFVCFKSLLLSLFSKERKYPLKICLHLCIRVKLLCTVVPELSPLLISQTEYSQTLILY